MVTVIIPMYNAEKTIERALDSVKDQTASKLIKSIIVVDDGSTDSSADIVKAYMNRYPYLPLSYVRQENKGVSSARNQGYKAAYTKYVAFLDADDIWLPNKLERQLQTIKENPQIRFLGTEWSEKPLKIGLKKITSLYNGTVKDLCIKNFPATPSILMETSFREEVGYFDEERRFAEDSNYFQKIAALGNYYFLPEKLVEVDNGKRYFAECGLSSHLKEMHRGTIQNIRELKEAGLISGQFWFAMRIFHELKYFRRIINKKRNAFFKGLPDTRIPSR